MKSDVLNAKEVVACRKVGGDGCGDGGFVQGGPGEGGVGERGFLGVGFEPDCTTAVEGCYV